MNSIAMTEVFVYYHVVKETSEICKTFYKWIM